MSEKNKPQSVNEINLKHMHNFWYIIDVPCFTTLIMFYPSSGISFLLPVIDSRKLFFKFEMFHQSVDSKFRQSKTKCSRVGISVFTFEKLFAYDCVAFQILVSHAPLKRFGPLVSVAWAMSGFRNGYERSENIQRFLKWELNDERITKKLFVA